MKTFEKWLDEEYTVAKLTLLSGQRHGKKLTKRETEDLEIQFKLLELIQGEYNTTDVFGGALRRITEYVTPIEKIAEKEDKTIDQMSEIIIRSTDFQNKQLMEKHQITFEKSDLKIERSKRRIQMNYLEKIATIKKDIETALEYIPT